jgi:hypothetical protein
VRAARRERKKSGPPIGVIGRNLRHLALLQPMSKTPPEHFEYSSPDVRHTIHVVKSWETVGSDDTIDLGLGEFLDMGKSEQFTQAKGK